MYFIVFIAFIISDILLHAYYLLYSKFHESMSFAVFMNESLEPKIVAGKQQAFK